MTLLHNTHSILGQKRERMINSVVFEESYSFDEIHELLQKAVGSAEPRDQSPDFCLA